jgi:hypothetical protein
MKVSENDIQRQIVDWIRYVAPECMVVAIPNGSRRTISGRAANAVPGLTPGAPDLVVIRPKGEVLWLEVKSEKGYVSDNQLKFHCELHVRNHTCAVVRSIDDVRLAFKHVNIKTREV